MQKLKLSAVFSALAVAGFSQTAQATSCSPDTKFISNEKIDLQCSKVEYIQDQPDDRAGLTVVNNAELNLKDSQLSLKAFDEDASPALIYSQNSTLNILNSDLVADTGMGSAIRMTENSRAEIQGSTITINNGYNGASAVMLSSSQLVIRDTTISANEGVAFSAGDTGNSITLDKVKIDTDVTIGTDWMAQGGTEYVDLNLTLNNSEINSNIIALGLPSEDDGNYIETINMGATNSKLSGLIGMADGTPKETAYNLTLNNSYWTVKPYTDVEPDTNLPMTFFNKVTNLTLNQGSVNFEKVDGFQTLTIQNDLSGTGNFTLNTDLANEKADKIIVKGKDSGEFGLNIQDSENEPKSANGKVTLVETQTGTANFKLLGNDYVDAGAYRYRLVKTGNNWLLSNNSAEPSNTTNQQGNSVVQDATGQNSGSQNVVPPALAVSPPQKSLSEKTNALVSLRQAQLLVLDQDLRGIHQRLGETKGKETGNVWVRNINNRNQFATTATAGNSASSGFEQDIHAVQIGADTAISQNFRAGGFVSAVNSDVDFNGEYGSGKVKSRGLGLYGTLMLDNGFYWDNIAKYDHLTATSAKTDKRSYNAYTLSTEVGRIHSLNHGWTITPQIQGAWTSIASQFDEDRLSAITGRIGVRVAKAFDFTSWKLQPYAEINGVTSKNNQAKIRVNQYDFDVTSSRNRLETAVGFNAVLGNHKVGVEGKVTQGKYLDQPYSVQAVYRYSW